MCLISRTTTAALLVGVSPAVRWEAAGTVGVSLQTSWKTICANHHHSRTSRTLCEVPRACIASPSVLFNRTDSLEEVWFIYWFGPSNSPRLWALNANHAIQVSTCITEFGNLQNICIWKQNKAGEETGLNSARTNVHAAENNWIQWPWCLHSAVTEVATFGSSQSNITTWHCAQIFNRTPALISVLDLFPSLFCLSPAPLCKAPARANNPADTICCLMPGICDLVISLHLGCR